MAFIIAVFAIPSMAAEKKTYLFILCGQSNMNKIDPASFKNIVQKAFPGDEIIVVKDSQSGNPIRSWLEEWKTVDGKQFKMAGGKRQGKLYDRLMGMVKPAIKDKKLDSVTFVWMQGEADAKEYGREYEGALKALMAKIKKDINQAEMNFVLGRISDYGIKDKERPYWNMIREVQVKVAEADPRGEWVDTDDLNGPANGLHYDGNGVIKLTERFAEKSVKLVKEHDAK